MPGNVVGGALCLVRCRVGGCARQVSRTCGGGVMMGLPVGLAGPVGFELAQPMEALPGEKALPGGSRYEPKWDGYLF